MTRKYNAPHQLPRKDTKKLLRVTGFPAVSALFATAPERVEKLFYDEKNKPHVGGFCSAMAKGRKLYKLVEDDELERVSGTILHGGIVAVAEPRPVLNFDLVEAAKWARDNKLLLLLDGVSNPHNLGAIVRTAAFLGVPRIVVSNHPAQALPSDASHRVAEGGMEYINLYRAKNFAQVVRKLSESHHVIGTAAEGAKTIGSLKKSNRPYALILGNEENGMSAETLAVCEDVVTIPGSGAVQSLNVSASAAILLYTLNGTMANKA